MGVAAEQTSIAGGVVRRSERTTGEQRLTWSQLAHNAVDLGGLQSLGEC